MDHCRVCRAKIKPHQFYCPNCGAKLPLLGKEELKDFKKFKKRFKPLFFLMFIMGIILFALFYVKTPVTKTMPYTVEEATTEIEISEIPLGCVKEDFDYFITHKKLEVYKEKLEVASEIENLEDEPGFFEYKVVITDKLSLKERQKTTKIFLGAHENKTVSVLFEKINSPNDVEYSYGVKPSKKLVCLTKTEETAVTKKREITKTKQEEEQKTLFELILGKI